MDKIPGGVLGGHLRRNLLNSRGKNSRVKFSGEISGGNSRGKSPEEFLETMPNKFLNKICRRISGQNPRMYCCWKAPEKFLEKVTGGVLGDISREIFETSGRIPGRNPRSYCYGNSPKEFLAKIPGEVLEDFPGGIVETSGEILGGNLWRNS